MAHKTILNFAIKVNPETNTKVGFLKTLREKFYVNTDGSISIIPIEDRERQSLCGVFINGDLVDVPAEFQERVEKSKAKLAYIYKTLKNFY